MHTATMWMLVVIVMLSGTTFNVADVFLQHLLHPLNEKDEVSDFKNVKLLNTKLYAENVFEFSVSHSVIDELSKDFVTTIVPHLNYNQTRKRFQYIRDSSSDHYYFVFNVDQNMKENQYDLWNSNIQWISTANEVYCI